MSINLSLVLIKTLSRGKTDLSFFRSGFFALMAILSAVSVPDTSARATQPIISFFVDPVTTDPGIHILKSDQHFVAYPRRVPFTKPCVVFFCGSYSKPAHYQGFSRVVASSGYPVINLMYPDEKTILACESTKDPLCFEKMRTEIVWGIDVSPEITVDPADCIIYRLKRLFQYLAKRDPGSGWSRYCDGNEIRYDRLIVAGHSQGAGHAAFIARSQKVRGVIFFSGPDDYIDFQGQPAKWTFGPFTTHVSSFCAFLHAKDEIGIFEYQRAILMAMGITGPATMINEKADISHPRGQFLCTSLPPAKPGCYHNSTIVDGYVPLRDKDHSVYEDLWLYLVRRTAGYENPD